MEYYALITLFLSYLVNVYSNDFICDSSSNICPSIINCSANEACTIYCTETGCRDKNLYCPINGDCLILCDTNFVFGCLFNGIYAQNSLSLYINNTGSASRSMRQLDPIYCPIMGPCLFQSYDQKNTFYQIKVYNLLGINKYSQFNVACSGDYCGWGITMRCGHQYSESRICNIRNEWCPAEGCYCMPSGDHFCDTVFITLPPSGQLWHDDFLFGQNNEAYDYEGWFQLDWNQNDISNTIFITNTNNTYHGPFIGDSNGNLNDIEINTLTRYFYCPSDSIVNVNYDLIFACTNDTDYTLLKINDLEILNETMNLIGNVRAEIFIDGNLEIDSVSNKNCYSQLFRKQMTASYPITLPKDELNKLEISIAMHYNQQVSYITNLTIQCINATLHPTTHIPSFLRSSLNNVHVVVFFDIDISPKLNNKQLNEIIIINKKKCMNFSLELTSMNNE